MTRVLIICVIILSLLSCKKKNEITIEESKDNKESEVVVEKIEESKPLIKVSMNDVVKILVRSDGAPGMYLGDDGEVHGFYVDLETMIMEKMNQKYQFVPYVDVGPAAQGLKTGTSLSALSVPDVPDFRNFLNLSIPYENLKYVTFVKNGNVEIKGETKEQIILSLHGKRVGVQTQGHIYQILRDIKEIELIEYPTTTKAMEALDLGLIDAVPENRETGYYYANENNWDVKDIGESLLSFQICTGFSRAYDEEIINRYNKALKSLLDDGSVYKLRVKYYGEKAEEYNER